MLSKKEIKLLKLIKFTPIFIVGILSIIITLLLYVEKNIILKKDLETLKEDYLEKNRIIIKNEVDKIYDYITYRKSLSEKELKKDIKNRVEEAHRLMTFIYEKYKDKETKEQITTRIKDSLRELRFNDNRGYFYIYNLDSYNIMHPLLPNLENTYVLHNKDIRIRNIFETIKNALISKNETYTELYWEKPTDLHTEHKKITFNKLFKPYNWYIGTGEYVDDFEEKLRNEILSYINSIMYSKNGYIFVVDKEGTYLSHVNKSYLGVNRINLKDPNGFMITQEIIKQAKNGAGYIKYIGTIKPETKLPSEKITYVRGFSDWQWSIGTGFYTDELEKQIIEKENEYKEKYMNNLINLLIISLVMTVFFLSLSFYISKKLHRRFNKYKQQVLSQMNKSREKDNLIAQQSKMAAMGEMLENIAHQWRQPLSSISTISTGVKLQYEYGSIEKEEVVKSMESIAKTTKYLSQTIDDFRDYFSPNKEANYFNLKDILKKAFDLLENQLQSRDIILVKNLSDVYIFGFENEFLQVIINIINNSRDEFEKKDNINKYIFIDIIEEKEQVKIYIKDNAGGINEKIIEKIFEPYFTTKFKSQGTGIGLYMSKEIIEKHMHGKISVSNESFIFEENSYCGANFEITIFLEDEKLI
jgi:signal transduction histidine kinase